MGLLFSDSWFAYLIGQHINNNIGEVHDLLLVGAQRGAAQARRAHVQRAHPAAADHRAMHCHTTAQQHPPQTTRPTTLPVQQLINNSPSHTHFLTGQVGEPPKIHLYAVYVRSLFRNLTVTQHETRTSVRRGRRFTASRLRKLFPL